MADPYFVLKDMPGYVRAQRLVSYDYSKQKKLWLKKAVINTAKSGVFASDRTIKEYNERIWHLKPLELL
ncbi:MAG: glycogen/starch/alpha-glucan phosphorylase [Oscillospiraceae bacterium]|nr:glycogen/starch/alpha-glucan phosphorylase [Oscillospiraceae bacterium]